MQQYKRAIDQLEVDFWLQSLIVNVKFMHMFFLADAVDFEIIKTYSWIGTYRQVEHSWGQARKLL